MTPDEKCRDEKLQDGINRAAVKISALSSGKIDKYEYLKGEKVLPRILQKTTQNTRRG